jgi:hypothetical protein
MDLYHPRYSSEVVGHRGHLYPKRKEKYTGTCVMTKKGLLLPFPTLAHPFKSRETFFFLPIIMRHSFVVHDHTTYLHCTDKTSKFILQGDYLSLKKKKELSDGANLW